MLDSSKEFIRENSARKTEEYMKGIKQVEQPRERRKGKPGVIEEESSDTGKCGVPNRQTGRFSVDSLENNKNGLPTSH